MTKSKGIRRNIGSKAVFEEIVSLLSETKFKLSIDNYSEWVNIRPHSTSKVPCVCRNCGADCTLGISQFLNRSRMRLPICSCDKKCSWTTKSKFQRVMDWLNSNNTSLIGCKNFEDWKSLNPSINLPIYVTCNYCNVVQKTTVKNALRKSGIQCFCRGGMRWSSDDGRRFLNSLISESRFELHMKLPEELSNSTMFSMRCTFCNSVVCTNVNNFRRGLTGCRCNNSTENDVCNFVNSVLTSGQHLHRSARFDNLVGIGGRRLEFDACVEDFDGTKLCFIEIDGWHHFDPMFQWTVNCKSSESLGVQEHDLRKDIFAFNINVPMIRIYQRDVEYSKCDWKPWLATLLEKAIHRTLKPGIHCCSTKMLYSTGHYNEMRVCTVLEGCVFEWGGGQ